jgi:hypothetical protein
MIDREPLQGAPTGAHEPGVASLDAAPLLSMPTLDAETCFLLPRRPISAFSNRHLGNIGYVRFPLSLRQVEDLLFERGIDICHETVRFWWNRFRPMFAAAIRKRRVHHRSYSSWRACPASAPSRLMNYSG